MLFGFKSRTAAFLLAPFLQENQIYVFNIDRLYNLRMNKGKGASCVISSRTLKLSIFHWGRCCLSERCSVETYHVTSAHASSCQRNVWKFNTLSEVPSLVDQVPFLSRAASDWVCKCSEVGPACVGRALAFVSPCGCAHACIRLCTSAMNRLIKLELWKSDLAVGKERSWKSGRALTDMWTHLGQVCKGDKKTHWWWSKGEAETGKQM